MADEVDFADQIIEDNVNRAVGNIKSKVHTVRESEEFCIDCDEPIPEQRRIAVKGCERCADCQNKFEIKEKVNYSRRR